MGWQDSNLRMTESKSVELPTFLHPNMDRAKVEFIEESAHPDKDFLTQLF